MNQRTASAPYRSTIGSGSMVFFFDFDIFSTRPRLDRRAGRALDQRAALADLDLVGRQPAAVGGLIGLVGHHPLGEQALERLRDVEPADPLQRAGPEAGVEQVQDRMLDPADILPDRQPASASARSNGWSSGWLAKRMKYQLELTKVSSVSVSRRAARAALRAIDLAPGRVAVERIAGNVEADVLGQDDRQLVARHRRPGRRSSQWMIGIGVPQ